MSVNTTFLDDEIDFRKWVSILLKRFWWIVGIAFGAAVLAFAVTSFMPPTYEATSVAVATQVYNQLRFDPRIETVSEVKPNYSSYATLATSDSLVKDLYESLDPKPEGITSPLELRSSLKAEVADDLILLNAYAATPQQAETIANLWLEIFVRKANAIYKSENGEQAPFFEQQRSEAQEILEEAQSDLVEFQSRNLETILNNRLTSLQETQAGLLVRQQAIQTLMVDIESLVEQLRQLPASQAASQSIQMSAIYLQTRAFAGEEESMPVQFQISDNSNAEPQTAGALIQQLEALAMVMEGQLARLEAQVGALEPQITEVQMQIEEMVGEKNALTSRRDLASETYETLARKVDEARIASQDTSGQVKVASRALANNNNVSPRRLLTTIIAGAGMLLLAVIATLVLEWWNSPQVKEQSQPGKLIP